MHNMPQCSYHAKGTRVGRISTRGKSMSLWLTILKCHTMYLQARSETGVRWPQWTGSKDLKWKIKLLPLAGEGAGEIFKNEK